MRDFLWAQTLLVLVGVFFSYYFIGDFGAQSAAYGGGIALFSSLILLRRTARAMRLVENGSSQIMGVLYVGLIQRYIFVFFGLAVGLGLFKLNAKPLLIVFGIAQLVYFMPWLGKE